MINKKNLTIIFTMTVLISVSFMMTYVFNNLQKSFVNAYESDILILQKEFTVVNDILEIKGKIANEIINEESIAKTLKEQEFSEIISYFEYDPVKDIFHLDKLLESGIDTSELNNITGKGNLDFLVDENNVKTKEIYMSLLMNQRYYRINERIDTSYWVYYTSLNKLLSIRNQNKDFVLSEHIHYDDKILDMTFVTEGTKEKLPNRERVFWTHPYIDLGGGGLMVTASYPVDYEGEYIGSISIDFQSRAVTSLLDTKYMTFIIDDKGTVISANRSKYFNGQLKNVEELGLNVKFEELTKLEPNLLYKLDRGFLIAQQIENTPYKAYHLYEKPQYLKDVFITLLPLIIFLIMFGILIMIYLKVYKSEKKQKEMVKELNIKQVELDYVAMFDQLTDVYNRRGLYKELEKMDIQKSTVMPCIIMVDIDHFKKVNDTYGHDVGDIVLVELCKVMNSCVGPNEIVARYGGEEFLAVLRNSTLEEALEVAERLRTLVESHYFETVEHITISLGVAKFEEGDTKDSWFKNADNALYEAKDVGRNVVCFFENGNIEAYAKSIINYKKNRLHDGFVSFISKLPVNIAIWTTDKKVVYISDKVLENYKTTKEFYLNNYMNFVPEYQASGENSQEIVDTLLKRVEDENCDLNLTVVGQRVNSEGDIFDVEVTYNKVVYEGEKYLLIIYNI